MSSPSLEEILGVGDNPTPVIPPDTTQTPPANQVLQTGQPPPGSGISAEQYAEQQRRIDELARQNEELQRKVTALPQERIPQTIPTTLPQNISPAEAKQQLEAAYLSDPIGFLSQYGQIIAGQVEQRIRAEYKPLGGAMTNSAIESFKQSMKGDPMYATVEPIFDKLLQSDGANLDPGKLPQQLDTLYSTAYGEAIRKRPADGRQNAPPNYAMGAAAGGSANSGLGGENGQRKLSDEDRIYIETMKEEGYTPEQIATMMKARNG